MEVLTLREKFGDTVIDVRACDSFGKDTGQFVVPRYTLIV